VTRRSIMEYADAVRARYQAASKKGKSQILDEFTAATKLHRKTAIRLFNRRSETEKLMGKGRPRLYGLDVMPALKTMWEATDRLCSKRFQPFVPELIAVLKRNGELSVTEETEAKLCSMSASSIDRLLRRQEPGFLEVDLVAHCGESTDGFYLTTLSAVDVSTGWYESVALWGKGQERVGAAVHHIKQRLPMPLRGPGLGQRQRVHQSRPLQLLPPVENQLHQVALLQEE